MRLRRQVLVLQLISSRSRNFIRICNCHVIQMLWLLYVSVGLAHAPAPTSLFLLLAGLLGGHTLAVSVSPSMQLAPEIRESRAAETIGSNGPIDYVTLCDATSPPTYPAREYGINHSTIIYTNIFIRFTNTIFGDNRGRDTDSRQSPKITVQGENHGNHGDREFVIYIHLWVWIYRGPIKITSVWFRAIGAIIYKPSRDILVYIRL